MRTRKRILGPRILGPRVGCFCSSFWCFLLLFLLFLCLFCADFLFNCAFCCFSSREEHVVSKKSHLEGSTTSISAVATVSTQRVSHQRSQSKKGKGKGHGPMALKEASQKARIQAVAADPRLVKSHRGISELVPEEVGDHYVRSTDLKRGHHRIGVEHPGWRTKTPFGRIIKPKPTQNEILPLRSRSQWCQGWVFDDLNRWAVRRSSSRFWDQQHEVAC